MLNGSGVTDPSVELEGHLPSDWDAAVLVVELRTDDPSLIFLKRSDQLSMHPGEVAFPGGMREAPDRDPVATAVREAYEEIGLDSAEVSPRAALPVQTSSTGLRVVPIHAEVRSGLKFTACGVETECVFTVPLAFFRASRVRSVYRLSRDGGHCYVPKWDWEGHEIWGLTAMILVSFLEHRGIASFETGKAPDGVDVLIPYAGRAQDGSG